MEIFHFGDFEFRPAAGELFRRGTPVPLQSQPARVLAILLAANGALVTRREIQRELWGEDTFVDYDQGLNFAIRQLRIALGDSASEPRFIETLPRRGYRFRMRPAPAPAVAAPAAGRARIPLRLTLALLLGLGAGSWISNVECRNARLGYPTLNDRVAGWVHNSFGISEQDCPIHKLLS